MKIAAHQENHIQESAIPSQKINDPDWAWIEEAKKGNQLAFEKLYRKHSGKLFALCIHFCQNIHQAEDELQEIMIKLVQGLPRFRQEASFSTWAYRIAMNHLIKASRKKSPRFDPLEPDLATVPSTNLALELSLAKTLKSLPRQNRQVFLLHERLGLSHDEIANILGCTVANSRSMLCRARIGLRESLSTIRKEAQS